MSGSTALRIRRSLLFTSVLGGPRVFDLPSVIRFLALQKAGHRIARVRTTVALRVRGFDRQPIRLRAGTTDWETAHSTFLGGYHLPPDGAGSVRTILDLGANIGLTLADLAARYPQARILGVELDADNVALARRNTRRWADRVEVVHGAVWTHDGTIAYGGPRGEDGYRVLPAMPDTTAAPAIAQVPALSMANLIDRLAPGGVVDYVKMDVEGTERFLLADGGDWADRVGTMKVELHRPFGIEECAAELKRLGFDAEPDPTGIACVIARRSPALS